MTHIKRLTALQRAILDVLSKDPGGATPQEIHERIPPTIDRLDAASIYASMMSMRTRLTRHWIEPAGKYSNRRSPWRITEAGLKRLAQETS